MRGLGWGCRGGQGPARVQLLGGHSRKARGCAQLACLAIGAGAQLLQPAVTSPAEHDVGGVDAALWQHLRGGGRGRRRGGMVSMVSALATQPASLMEGNVEGTCEDKELRRNAHSGTLV